MAPIISFMAEVALRSTLVLGVVFLVLAMMRRASASERHLVLLLGLFVVALTPVGVGLSPKMIWTYDVPAPVEPVAQMPLTVVSENNMAHDSTIPVSSMEAPSPERSKWSFDDGLLAVLATGMAAQILLLGRAARAWRKIRLDAVRATLPDAALTRARTFAGKHGVPRILASDRITVPLLAGWRRPEIILPTEANAWPVSRLAMVLCHEIAHFLRGDTLFLPFGALMRVLFWWHPLVWLALARLRRERENACDDLVLAQNFRATDYAELIVETARQARANSAWPATALAMASSKNFSERIRAILDPAVRRKSAGRWSILTGLALALAVGWPLVATEIQAQEKPATQESTAVPAAGSAPAKAQQLLVKVSMHFMEIDETTYAKDPSDLDKMVKDGEVASFGKLPGVTLAGEPFAIARAGEQMVMEQVRVIPVQDPVTKVYKKHDLGYRVVLQSTVKDDQTISISSFPEVTEYMGMIQNQGMEQPDFNTHRVHLQFVSKDGETKGFWLEDGYHLTELMKAINQPVKSLNQADLLPPPSTGPGKRLAVFYTITLWKHDGVPLGVPLTEKVKNTWIEEIDFKNARIEDVLLYLQAESKRTDPEHVGVHFEIDQMPPPHTQITLNMAKVPLKVVLDKVAVQANIKYVVEDQDVVFGPIDPDLVGPLQVQTFTHIPQGFFGPFHPGPLDPKTGDFVNDARTELEAMGVKFEGNADAKYLTSLKDDVLVVNNTEDELNKIRQLLANYVPMREEVAYSFYMVEVDEKAYVQDKDAMDKAVENGDIHYFDNKKTLSVKRDRVVVRVGEGAWCAEGLEVQHVESVVRVTKDGKSHTEINLADEFAGVHIDCGSSVTSFPGSSLGPPKGPIRLHSTVLGTEYIGADTLPLSRDIPPGDITKADEMPIRPLYHAFKFTYNDWEPAAGKMHGRWFDGVLDHDILDHPRDPQAFSSGRVYPKAPCRLAVFLGAEMVKVPVNTPNTGR